MFKLKELGTGGALYSAIFDFGLIEYSKKRGSGVLALPIECKQTHTPRRHILKEGAT